MIPILYSLIAFASAIALNALMVRLLRGVTAVVSFVLTGGLVGLALAFVLYGRDGVSPSTLGALLVYAFCCELFIFVFTLSLVSIGANLILELARHREEGVDVSLICESRTMVSARLDRLVFSGLLRARQAPLELTPKGRTLVSAVSAVRRFFRHDDPI